MPLRRHPIASTTGNPDLARVAIDSDLVARLRSSYSAARLEGARVAELFYERLFEAAPAVRPMFRAEPAVQQAKLMAALDLIIDNLEQPDTNAEALRAMGRRHAAYGALPAHYELVSTLLAGAIVDATLGSEANTPGLRDDWTMVIRLIGDQMIAAGSSPPR